jgi:uncharacterized protein
MPPTTPPDQIGADSSSPRDAFARFQRAVLDGSPTDATHIAEDVLVEWPFSPPGRPRSVQGRETYLAFAAAGREALPVRFDEFRNVVIHDTSDPEVIVVEWDLTGTHKVTGVQATASFVTMLRVRDGEVVHIREYQDVLTMATVLGQLPDLMAELAAR